MGMLAGYTGGRNVVGVVVPLHGGVTSRCGSRATRSDVAAGIHWDPQPARLPSHYQHVLT